MRQRFEVRAVALVIGALALVCPGAARADIVFNNFGPSFSYNTNAGLNVGIPFAGVDAASGSTFTPTQTYTLNSIVIALSAVDHSTNADALTVSLTTTTAGHPGNVLENFTVAPGTLGAFGPPLRTPLTLTSLLHPTLSAGTEYWVTVRDPAPTELDAWNANNTFDPSSEAFSSDGGQTWTVPSGNDPGAYEVNGALVATAAPEPGSLALVCGGTLTLLCGRWKRLLRKAGTK